MVKKKTMQNMEKWKTKWKRKESEDKRCYDENWCVGFCLALEF